jgi:glycerol dehydrogenase-like iron-containing ADH family enzyme
MGSRARPAAEIDVRFGHGVLHSDSRDWPRYVAVTSPSAYAAAQGYLAAPPAGTAFVESLDYGYLQHVAESLRADVELVVGLGGGRAIDAAKHIAVAKDVPVVQVPTIVSSGAIIHGYCGRHDGRTVVGERDDWVWADCEYVLVDYDLVLSAPRHLNTAGLGDVLCEQSGIAEWRHSGGDTSRRAAESEALARLDGFHRRVVADFVSTLAAGQLTAGSITSIVRAIQERDGHRVLLHAAPMVDHYFLAELEEIHDRSWIHGEVVALGALVVIWCCSGDAAGFAAALDRCLIRRRPAELGITKDMLAAGLAGLADYLSGRPGTPDYDSVMRSRPLDSARLDELWAFLEGAPAPR